MRALLLSQIVEQLPDTGVGCPCGSLFVEAACLHLHGTGLIANGFETERPYQPDRLPGYEASDVMTANQRYVVAELLPKEFDQAPPVARLLFPHAVEDRRRGREVLAETVGKI